MTGDLNVSEGTAVWGEIAFRESGLEEGGPREGCGLDEGISRRWLGQPVLCWLSQQHLLMTSAWGRSAGEATGGFQV